ncbi:hypothetical protein CUU64_12930 [Bacillus sp. V5-8f]|nr:hypothetical protein CUU64_12930 [Bacillus sp. V5-8f]
MDISQLDLVVFPEAFIQLNNENDAWPTIEYIANYLDKPVLLGFSIPDGSERAYYLNWEPNENETANKTFIKHSTAMRTFFDYDLTDEEIDNIYKPIVLNG